MIRQRCAIYTRKSTEEGLEQEFNSLDAQREACAAYILSQKHEGWMELSDRYDDGGYSGGTMDRPGLKHLLGDVRRGRIDVIVVYKVDRLTRSLADFARMVDLFDGAGVSFVSVTQAFNTTSSMGRLTLNVLLSFAQFEREVTAERIRDKVAASKRKGMWMGGAVPLGYDARDKSLVINRGEASAIRTIFAEYLAVGSVRQLVSRLKELGVVSKRRTDRHGRVSGGEAFSRGSLYNILRNPIYIGKIRHKDSLHDGLHEAIIDDVTWARVQALLADHGSKKISAPRRAAKRLLDGVLFDQNGRAMRTTYASKSVRHGGTARTKRYWYYTSKPTGAEDGSDIARLPAKEIERLVLSSLKTRLCDRSWLADQISRADVADAPMADILRAAEAWQSRITSDDRAASTQCLSRLIDRIEATGDRLCIWLNLYALLVQDAGQSPVMASFEVPFRKRQNGSSRPFVITPEDTPQPDPDLIALVADARRWAGELLEGKPQTIQQITEREGLRSGSVSRVLPLAWLAPDITTAILEGRQPPHLTAKFLRGLPELPLSWEEQRRILGFLYL
ncbi:recombinase family protein [Sulfitobacter sp. JBTF-M27]|uniref:Recombinase family protein n=1 Tax=Sulfitobacter sediminilitoris TaxID=2698830 RepID=A0A6P0C9P8_9RHOB|nr:recombinase family protein [Sulfitobacter sediminilitoris]NEK21858.1 recombinase family protein [Sulfitobacter sediminilitoris]